MNGQPVKSNGREEREPQRSSLDRELPHDFDAERAVLGSMLLDASAIADAADVLRSGHSEFWNERHGQLYQVIADLHATGKPIDDVVIRDTLKRTGDFDRLGGYDFLAECINSVASHFRVREYASIVHDHYIRRQVISAASQSMDVAFNNAPIADVVSCLTNKLNAVSELALSRSREDGSLMDIVADALDKLGSPEASKDVIPTGFFGLDSLIYGFEPGELVMIGARPSRGKTALALNIAESVSINEKVPTLFFSLEMRRIRVVIRMILARARVNGHVVRSGNLNDADWASIVQAAKEVKESNLLIFNRTRRLQDIVNTARILVRERGVKVVMIDYLQLVDAGHSFEMETLRIAEITRTLKVQVAEELGVCVVLLAQLNRKIEEEKRPPRMSDFRDSGAIEQDADKIILPWQDPSKVTIPPGVGTVEGEVELIVAKHRDGPTGSAPLYWRPQFARFENPRPSEDSLYSYRP